jgi:hypothetical protein
MLRSASFTLGILAGALSACSSAPLADGTATAGGTGGSGGQTAGSGAQPGSSGGGGAAVTDYTTSPCYGEPASTEVYDLTTHATHSVAATCRAEGSFARVYVADALWQTELGGGGVALDQALIDAFMAGLERHGKSGSAHPELGVLPADEAVYGDIPGAKLTDGKLPIYVIDASGAGDGYLCSWCDNTQLHLDYTLLGSLERTLSTAAHEAYHAIHHGYDPTEAMWVDETFAESAMTVNGYYTDQQWVSSFLRDPNVEWGPGLTSSTEFNYGAGLLFGTFLWERDGADFMAAVTQDPEHEWAGIDSALASVGDTASSWELWNELGLALLLDDPASGYALTSFELGAKVATTPAASGQALAETLKPYGFVFVTFDASATRFTLTSDGELAASLVYPGAPADVRDVPLGQSVELETAPRGLVLSARQQTRSVLTVE